MYFKVTLTVAKIKIFPEIKKSVPNICTTSAQSIRWKCFLNSDLFKYLRNCPTGSAFK